MGKLYRKDFLNHVDIKNIGITHGEDLCYNIQCFPYAKRIICIPENVYFYRFGGMTNQMNEKLLDDAVKAYQFKWKMIEKWNLQREKQYTAIEMLNFLFTYLENHVIYKKFTKSQLLQLLAKKVQLEEIQHAISVIDSEYIKESLIGYTKEEKWEELCDCIMDRGLKNRRKRNVKYFASQILKWI